MTDTTFFGTSFIAGGPPLKRRRQEEPPQVISIIEDKRIPAGEGLRLDCDLLTIKVGPYSDVDPNTQETFTIHEHALCDRSSYFANAMKPEWASQRADPRVLELPDDDPEAFALYRTWLYSGKLPILPDDPADSVSAQEGYNVLAYAYVLGERLCDNAFKNAIADAYVIYARGASPAKRYYPSNEEIRIIYDGTRQDSPIRQLLVDIWYSRGRAEWTEQEGAEDLPRDFLLSVTRALFLVRQKEGGKGTDGVSRPWKGSHTQYHEK